MTLKLKFVSMGQGKMMRIMLRYLQYVLVNI